MQSVPAAVVVVQLAEIHQHLVLVTAQFGVQPIAGEFFAAAQVFAIGHGILECVVDAGGRVQRQRFGERAPHEVGVPVRAAALIALEVWRHPLVPS